jgi:hypothetical protein
MEVGDANGTSGGTNIAIVVVCTPESCPNG